MADDDARSPGDVIREALYQLPPTGRRNHEALEPALAAVRRLEEVEHRLAVTLRYLAAEHHRTLTNSRLHDPEHIDSFTECPTLTCRKAAATLRALDA